MNVGEVTAGDRSGFATYGMFIVDKIVEADGRTLEDIAGGAGTFAVVGARMFSAAYTRADNALLRGNQCASFIVDYGNDVPSHIVEQIRSLGLDLIERHDDTRQCTRGLNTYDSARGVRTFEYTTPKLRITPSDLPERMRRARSVHCVCSPGRVLAILNELDGLVSETDRQDRVLVWEPIPDCCFRADHELPNEDGQDLWLEEYRSASRRCTIISPNAHELSGLAGTSAVGERSPDFEQWVEHTGRSTLTRLDAKIMVVRCGARGSCLFTRTSTSWTPAYLQKDTDVIDPTGAGNTFCGALARLVDPRGLDDIHHLEQACRAASVAAGLACMQVGLPVLTNSPTGEDLWNGSSIARRMASLHSG